MFLLVISAVFFCCLLLRDVLLVILLLLLLLLCWCCYRAISAAVAAAQRHLYNIDIHPGVISLGELVSYVCHNTEPFTNHILHVHIHLFTSIPLHCIAVLYHLRLSYLYIRYCIPDSFFLSLFSKPSCVTRFYSPRAIQSELIPHCSLHATSTLIYTYVARTGSGVWPRFILLLYHSTFMPTMVDSTLMTT